MKKLAIAFLITSITVGALIDHDLLMPIKILSLNLLVFLLFMYLNIYIHELGHVIAAKLVRFEVSHVVIGEGRELFRFNILGLLFIITNGFYGGVIYLWKVESYFLRLRYFIYILGGVFLQFCMVALLIFYIRNGGEEFMLAQSVPVITLFIISNIITIILELTPRRYKLHRINTPSDGLCLLTSFSLTERDFGILLFADQLRESGEYLAKGEYDLAEKGYKAILEQAPYLTVAIIWLSVVYLKTLNLEKAEALLLSALDQADHEEHSAEIFNSLAWIYLLQFDSQRLGDADKYSRLALELDPDSNAIIGTRGATLILLGEYIQGISLLKKISDIDKPIDPISNNASNYIFLGYAYSLMGDLETGLPYLGHAETHSNQLEPDERIFYDKLFKQTKTIGQETT